MAPKQKYTLIYLAITKHMRTCLCYILNIARAQSECPKINITEN